MKTTLYTLFFCLILALGSCKPESPVDPENPSISLAKTDDKPNPLPMPGVPSALLPIVIAGQPNAPGFVNGPGQVARFNQPLGIFVNLDGSILVADYANQSIRKIISNNSVSTLVKADDVVLDVAALNNGTVGIITDSEIEFYKNGVFRQPFYECFHCTLTGIDKDPRGTFFWYTDSESAGLNTIQSYVSSITENLTTPQPSKGITNTYSSSISVSSKINKFFTTENGLFTCTQSGSVSEILPNVPFAGLQAVVTNKDNTKLYIADGRDIKLITRCPTCPTLLTKLVSNVDASGLALSNSEKVLYFTSAKHHTVSKINL
ncbi:hypothetical protein [Mucilaginibacter aquaedulcis]|uniref:hypothetical protein n=1 Tax=Mucilaginibacter aquaedulcis TaxID=1187081 RepID=UPI0025B51EA8|nr:hypothetical protein [Mucilaginibacter aquaedulcis]MDN3551254.1 hypothetical protein [Mucilaginibacter aquaedulcis]